MPNILQGTVTKAGAMAKTITVTIERRFEHPKYLKQLLRHTKKLVHDELQEAKIGDRVSITHTRPLSSSKHFYLSAIDSRPTDGMRSVPIQGGVPELPPPKTMEQVRKRAAAVEKKRVEDEAKAAAASVRAEAAVQESNGDKREGEAAEISSDQAVGMGEMGRAVESSGADVSPRL